MISSSIDAMSFQEQELGLQVLANRGGHGDAAAPAMPWWAGPGAAAASLQGGEAFGQSSHAMIMEGNRRVHGHHQILSPGRWPHHAAVDLVGGGLEMPTAECCVVKLPIFSGDYDLGKEMKFQEPTVATYQALQEYHQGRFELALRQSMVCTSYANAEGSYGMYCPYGSQAMSGRMLLPSPIATEMPIYVNARQFNGILRRRLARAKVDRGNGGIPRNRKPYLHESRHRHAMRRARGCGGRFLNTKNLSGDLDGGSAGQPARNSNSSPSNEWTPDHQNGGKDDNSAGAASAGLEALQAAEAATCVYPAATDDMDDFHHAMGNLRPLPFFRL